MSRENLEQFRSRVLNDKSLSDELKMCTDIESLTQRSLELAAGFTKQEVQEAMREADETLLNPGIPLDLRSLDVDNIVAGDSVKRY